MIKKYRIETLAKIQIANQAKAEVPKETPSAPKKKTTKKGAKK